MSHLTVEDFLTQHYDITNYIICKDLIYQLELDNPKNDYLYEIVILKNNKLKFGNHINQHSQIDLDTNIKIELRAKEHNPPHIHITLNHNKWRFFINPAIPYEDNKKCFCSSIIIDWINLYQQDLLELWHTLNPSLRK